MENSTPKKTLRRRRANEVQDDYGEEEEEENDEEEDDEEEEEEDEDEQGGKGLKERAARGKGHFSKKKTKTGALGLLHENVANLQASFRARRPTMRDRVSNSRSPGIRPGWRRRG